MKLLTILIPTYNMEMYLNNCLTSLVLPSINERRLIEVLIIIDGAKDRSSEIAHCYQKDYPEEFRVIDKENGNYGSCINRGLLEAKGKYVKVLDADDSFNIESLVSFVHALKFLDCDMILTDYVIIDQDGNERDKISFDFESNKIVPIEKLDLRKQLKSLGMHAITYRRDMLISMKYKQTEGISYTDTEWDVYPIQYSQSLFYYKKVLYKYLIGREGQTVDPIVSAKRIYQKFIIINRFEKFITTNNKIDSNRIRYMEGRMVDMIASIYRPSIILGQGMKMDELIDFDDMLKAKTPHLYELSNECFITGLWKFNYIYEWRNHKNVFFYIKVMLFRFVSKLRGY